MSLLGRGSRAYQAGSWIGLKASSGKEGVRGGANGRPPAFRFAGGNEPGMPSSRITARILDAGPSRLHRPDVTCSIRPTKADAYPRQHG